MAARAGTEQVLHIAGAGDTSTRTLRGLDDLAWHGSLRERNEVGNFDVRFSEFPETAFVRYAREGNLPHPHSHHVTPT